MEALVYAAILSIPFYFIWNALAPTYFNFLPELYRHLPFWDCMGLLVLASIVRVVLLPAPTIITKFPWKRK